MSDEFFLSFCVKFHTENKPRSARVISPPPLKVEGAGAGFFKYLASPLSLEFEPALSNAPCKPRNFFLFNR